MAPKPQSTVHTRLPGATPGVLEKLATSPHGARASPWPSHRARREQSGARRPSPDGRSSSEGIGVGVSRRAVDRRRAGGARAGGAGRRGARAGEVGARSWCVGCCRRFPEAPIDREDELAAVLAEDRGLRGRGLGDRMCEAASSIRRWLIPERDDGPRRPARRPASESVPCSPRPAIWLTALGLRPERARLVRRTRDA